MKSLRIFHVVETLGRGGLERMVVDLARGQSGHGHRVEVACLFEPGVLAAELQHSGIPVHVCHKGRGADPLAAWVLRRAIGKFGARVVHTHNAVAHYYAVAATLGLRHVARINTRHGMGNAPFNGQRERLYQWALRHTAFAVMVCEEARRNFVSNGIVPGRQARVVANGICLDGFLASTESEPAGIARSLGIDPGGLRIGIVARLNPVKDHRSLLRAFARVLPVAPRAQLLVIGGGDLMQELQELARELGVMESTSFLGDREDVPRLLRALDIFVLSSLSEGYSMALLEASAAGLPIVATDVGGNRDILGGGERGVLVPAGNPDALAGALAGLVADVPRRRQLGERARAWVTDHGSTQAMALRYEELYRHALAS